MRWKILWSLLLALGLSLAGGGRSQAAAPIAALNVDAQLQNDGSLRVSQTLRYYEPAPLDWTIYGSVQEISVTADGRTQTNWFSQNQGDSRRLVDKSAHGQWLISYRLSSALVRRDDRDQLFIKVLDTPGRAVDSVAVILDFSQPITADQFSFNAYTIGSRNPKSEVLSPSVVRFRSELATSAALFTASASWPKNVIALTAVQNWQLTLMDFGLGSWLLLGLLLPLFTLIVFILLLTNVHRGERKVSEVLTAPPATISPMLLGVLVDKAIQPSAIVATLVDLCQRGYLVIVRKNSGYYLSQRRLADQHLAEWERELIDQLFPSFGVVVSEEDAKSLGKKSFFSPKIRDAFRRAYAIATAVGVFVENPHLTRIRFRLFGLTFYFLALVGTLWVMFSNIDTPLLFPLLGSLGLAAVVIHFSERLTRYTKRGEADRERWLAFANYLAKGQPLGLEAVQTHLFERYLPYAICLGHTLAWANRFEAASTVIIRPDWFVSYEDLSPVELAESLVAFTQIISEELTKLHGPTL